MLPGGWRPCTLYSLLLVLSLVDDDGCGLGGLLPVGLLVVHLAAALWEVSVNPSRMGYTIGIV